MFKTLPVVAAACVAVANAATLPMNSQCSVGDLSPLVPSGVPKNDTRTGITVDTGSSAFIFLDTTAVNPNTTTCQATSNGDQCNLPYYLANCTNTADGGDGACDCVSKNCNTVYCYEEGCEYGYIGSLAPFKSALIVTSDAQDPVFGSAPGTLGINFLPTPDTDPLPYTFLGNSFTFEMTSPYNNVNSTDFTNKFHYGKESDEIKVDSEWQTIPYSIYAGDIAGFYAVKFSKINGFTIPSETILDSGTTITEIDSKVFPQFLESINFTNNTNCFTDSNGNNCNNLKGLKNAVFTIGGKDFTLTPDQLFISNGTTYNLAFVPGQNFSIIGFSFIGQHQYTKVVLPTTDKSGNLSDDGHVSFKPFKSHKPTTIVPTTKKVPTTAHPTTKNTPTTKKPVNPGKDFVIVKGIDFKSKNIDISEVSNKASVSLCPDVCSKVKGCESFSWSSWNHGTCFLKKSPQTYVVDAKITSGALVPSGYKCDGNADWFGKYDVKEVHNKGFKDCAKVCESDSKCNAYVWSNFENGSCFLKHIPTGVSPSTSKSFNGIACWSAKKTV